MSTGRNNTPNWQHALAALATVATVWATIRTEVPAVVHTEVEAAMKQERAHMDSLMHVAWTIAQDSLHKRIEHEAVAVRDTMMSTLNIIATRPSGRVVYSPNITVAADTSGTNEILHRLDAIEFNQDAILHHLQPRTDQVPARKARPKILWTR